MPAGQCPQWTNRPAREGALAAMKYLTGLGHRRIGHIAGEMKLVSASRGKAARAEPVAARFEAGAAFFAGRFPELEDELAGLIISGGYAPGGAAGRSPDRADAMVWAMTELLKTPRAPSVRGL